MKKVILLFALITLLCSCEKEAASITTENLTESTAVVQIVERIPALSEPEVTEIITTEIVATTSQTTTATTEKTTAQTTKATTAQTEKPKPKETYSAHVPSVLEGEYAYGGEPIIEVIDGITYVNGILIANKTYSLPETFAPNGLHPDASAAFKQMTADAAAEGITLKNVSGYRSYRQQTSTYANFSKRDGKELADRYSARPGHSEHQTGLAIDINSTKTTFEDTPAGKWLAANCTKYGFILRYPKDKEHITGYMYEPWHVRYIGVPLAETIASSGLCLEEFLGITSVYAE